MEEKCIITSITISSANLNDGCRYCKSDASCWDHIIPKYLGGSNSVENLIPSCTQCNSSKGKKSLAQWRKDIKKFRHRWVSSEFETPDPYPIKGKRYLAMNGGFIKFESNNGELVINDFLEYAGHFSPYQDEYENAWLQAITRISKRAS